MISGHAHYLARRAQRGGLRSCRGSRPSAGLVVAGLLLRGHRELAAPGVLALAEHCDEAIGADGALASRKPSDMLEALLLLKRLRRRPWRGRIRRAPAAGGSQKEASADTCAPCAMRTEGSRGSTMVFGRRRVISMRRWPHRACGTGPRQRRSRRDMRGFRQGGATLDRGCGSPLRTVPGAHASLLAFELTSGRRPVIVGSGPGAGFGKAWHRAAREAASHSGLSLDDRSPGRLTPSGIRAAAPPRRNTGPDHSRRRSLAS